MEPEEGEPGIARDRSQGGRGEGEQEQSRGVARVPAHVLCGGADLGSDAPPNLWSHSTDRRKEKRGALQSRQPGRWRAPWMGAPRGSRSPPVSLPSFSSGPLSMTLGPHVQ